MAEKWKTHDVPIRIECSTCHFSKTVTPSDDEPAMKVLVRHGRETGHRLTAEKIEASVSSG